MSWYLVKEKELWERKGVVVKVTRKRKERVSMLDMMALKPLLVCQPRSSLTMGGVEAASERCGLLRIRRVASAMPPRHS